MDLNWWKIIDLGNQHLLVCTNTLILYIKASSPCWKSEALKMMMTLKVDHPFVVQFQHHSSRFNDEDSCRKINNGELMWAPMLFCTGHSWKMRSATHEVSRNIFQNVFFSALGWMVAELCLHICWSLRELPPYMNPQQLIHSKAKQKA